MMRKPRLHLAIGVALVLGAGFMFDPAPAAAQSANRQRSQVNRNRQGAVSFNAAERQRSGIAPWRAPFYGGAQNWNGSTGYGPYSYSYFYGGGSGYGQYSQSYFYGNSNNRAADFDGDGIPDSSDRDIDGDGVPNTRDRYDYDRTRS